MDIKAFLLENQSQETHKYVVSKRFKDKDANPIAWTIRPVGEKEMTQIRQEATTIARARTHKTNGIKIDTDLVSAKMLAHAVVEPNLKDANLQNSYGVQTDHELLKKMLYFGEYAQLSMFVTEISGMDINESEAIDELKN
jgi:hypothetical protein